MLPIILSYVSDKIQTCTQKDTPISGVSNFLQRFQRKAEVQRQMFAVLFGVGCEGSLHFFGEGAGDGESEAGAALVARIVWRVKTLEEPRHVIQR